MRSFLSLMSLSLLIVGFNANAAVTKSAAKANAQRAAAEASAAKEAAAKLAVAEVGDDGKFEPQALDVLPEKKIEEVDLSAAADQAIRDAAARLTASATKKPTAAPSATEAQAADSAKSEMTAVKGAAESTAGGVVESKAQAAIDNNTNINANSAAASTEATKNLKETEIPVLANFGAKKEAIASPWARIILSFLTIGALATGLILFSRWYNRRTKGTKDTNKIKILTQHFLGPKKSLAIVRVAGETILIGITDQNISMLKSLALLDDEIPESTPTHFGQSMVQADDRARGDAPGHDTYTAAPPAKAAVAATNIDREANYDHLEDLVVTNIKDKVFSKLKSLRPL